MNAIQKINIMGDWRGRVLALACSLAVWFPAMAQPVIQSISTSRQAGAEIVTIELTEALKAIPAGFAVQSPPRIALDLPGVSNGTGKPSVELNQGNVRTVNIAHTEDRTRLVISLGKPATYRAELQGKSLIVVLDAGVSPSVAAVNPRAAEDGVRFAEGQNRTQLPVKNIDFRRGADGAGRVVVDLANNQVGVDIRQQGQGLVVEFLRSSLPDNLRRRLDVVDFGTPVQAVTAVQIGDKVRMVVEPRGAWEHSAYQSDNQFVLEVRPQKIDPNKLTQGPGFAGEKLSLNFQNIEVRALLQVIADFTNFNVVTSDTVTGNVTLRLKDVPWDQALDIILQSRGLGLRKSGNVLMIAPKDELNAKEKGELESNAQIAALEPVRSQAFQLNYTKAEEVARGLSGESSGGSGAGGGAAATRILSPRGTVFSETRTNQLFVSDTPAKLEEIQSLISKIDVPVRQVLIEARIVEADDSFGRSLGVRLGGRADYGLKNSGGTRAAVGGNLNAVGLQSGQLASGSTATMSDLNFVNLPAVAQGGYAPASMAVSLFGSSANKFLNLEISALEADGRGKIISSPRIVTADQIKAMIQQGTKIPYQQATSSGATSVAFVDATLKLEVTPQITPEGNVIMSVEVNKDSVGASTQGIPSINTKSVKTQVLVENGGTVVIGGIFEQTERSDEAKVPLLGDVPVLGNLFKTKTNSMKKTELLIFLT
ncbi:MAG: secretin, partial [Burkholderiales bacterium 28-67-8]